MPLNLKPEHAVVKKYFKELEKQREVSIDEGTISPAFATLLSHCSRQLKWTLSEKYKYQRKAHNPLIIDGAILDNFNVPRGYWEAKDEKDILSKEITKKFEIGYPRDNILFQSPAELVLIQDDKEILSKKGDDVKGLVEILNTFFDYASPKIEEWDKAAEDFEEKLPKLGEELKKNIEKQLTENPNFAKALDDFKKLCKQTINPNISDNAVEEMLIQHLLTERMFAQVFHNTEFVSKNAIAAEIEKVKKELIAKEFSYEDFLNKYNLSRFYKALANNVDDITEFSQKQKFLNAVYEQFFQGFSVKIADTHGIVYTPEEVVNFMINSIEEILKTEFDGKSLASDNVHILDPFVGTGNFIVHVMQRIPKTRLEYKYLNELHCNEVMLLPYYIASLNIEHEYYEAMNKYEAFPGICLVDTFDIAEQREQQELFTKENTERVKKQKESPIFVILGNPPYNAGQVNENDNNKNRKYEVIDKRVAETYSKESKATNKNALSDPYVKAIRFASDRIGEEGIIAFVSNNSFIDGFAFDGMRKCLEKEFSKIYMLDLKGNVRKDSMREGFPIGEANTVFGLSAMVGIAITLFVKKKGCSSYQIYYSEVDWRAKRVEKFGIIDNAKHYFNLQYKEITPDSNHTWLNEGLRSEFSSFIPLGTKEAKAGKGNAVFEIYSNGVKTHRDSWVYNHDIKSLSENVSKTIETYNYHIFKWSTLKEKPNIDDFVDSDATKISWGLFLKNNMQKGNTISFEEKKIRKSMYRPFCKEFLFFDKILIEVYYQQPRLFPTPQTEEENKVICVPSAGGRAKFWCYISNLIVNVSITSIDANQCFPFFTYNEDGTGRKENITDWGLNQFMENYKDDKITKWDIFYYIYGLLHHPRYRELYKDNLKRELPRIPFQPDFWKYSEAGKALADLHINYEKQEEYPLEVAETEGKSLNYKVEKMHLSKEKDILYYNDFLTLKGIPKEAFEYMLGNKSALDWVIDQYRVKTDERSGITNDPNRDDDPEYILRLVKQIITVSLETMKIVKGLPEWEEA